RARASFLAEVEKVSERARSLGWKQNTAGVLRLAIDRHWELTLRPDSGVRRLRRWELAREMEEARKQGIEQGRGKVLGQAFETLRKPAAALIEKDIKERAKR